jgi:hypothetical protein
LRVETPFRDYPPSGCSFQFTWCGNMLEHADQITCCPLGPSVNAWKCMHACVCVCVSVCMRGWSLSLYVYVCVYVCACACESIFLDLDLWAMKVMPCSIRHLPDGHRPLAFSLESIHRQRIPADSNNGKCQKMNQRGAQPQCTTPSPVHVLLPPHHPASPSSPPPWEQIRTNPLPPNR